MPALSTNEAAERLAVAVESARPSDLPEIHAELFPEVPLTNPPVASELARHIRSGLEAEEIVDLWNVVFPGNRNVWYDEETGLIRYNEELVGYPE